MPIDLTSDGKVAEALKRLEQRSKNPGPFVRDVGEYLLREAKRKAPKSSGLGYQRGSVGLRASLNLTFQGASTVVLQSPLPYANIQNRGGTVKPKTAKYLTIPINADAHKLLGRVSAGKGLRSVKGLVVVKKKNGTLLLIERQKRKKTETLRGPVFVLVKSVTLAPNPKPDGYTPEVSEPRIAEWISKRARRHLSESN